MFGQFILGAIVGLIFLFVPGTLLFLALRLQKSIAIATAPIPSLLLYWIFGEIYRACGIFSNWSSVFWPVLGISICVFIVSLLLRKRGKIEVAPILQEQVAKAGRYPLAMLACYVLFGVVSTLIIFVFSISSVNDILPEFDITHHVGTIRTFVNDGIWSSFDTGAYGGFENVVETPSNQTPFYPTVWHTFCALIISATGIQLTTAVNVSNTLFCGVVFPAGMFAFLLLIFKGKRIPLLFGAFFAFAFTAFPWKYLIWGPLFPNLASFALMPSVCAFFYATFLHGIKRSERVIFAALMVIGLVLLAVTQTNAVFTMAVLFIPYCIYLASLVPTTFFKKARPGNIIAYRLLFGTLATVLIAGLWYFLFTYPSLQAVVQHVWASHTSKPLALLEIATLSFREGQPQYFLGLIVVIGIVATFVKRRLRWVSVAYLMMAFVYIMCAANDDPIKQLLGGFWYTDTIRIAASIAFFAVPLACIGLYSVVELIMLLLKKIRKSEKPKDPYSKQGIASEAARKQRRRISEKGIVSAICAAISIILIFFPVNISFGTTKHMPAMQAIAEACAEYYSPILPVENPEALPENQDSAYLYAPEEQEFVEKVKGIVGDDLVINMPEDGSLWSYSINNLNTYYRYTRIYEGSEDNEHSQVIRKRLSSLEQDEEAREALRSIGAKYLLQLDQGDDNVRNSVYLWTYNENDWIGINSVDESTPGFEIVLADGDMRLYRILD